MDIYAARWMFSIENNKVDAREINSLHPLWSQYGVKSLSHPVAHRCRRYIFPHDINADNGCIDLTEDEQYFYLNPYSGEMTLNFPKAERNCRGGILA